MDKRDISAAFEDAMLDSAHAITAEHGLTAGRLAARGMINGGTAALRDMIGDGAALAALWDACGDIAVTAIDDDQPQMITFAPSSRCEWDEPPGYFDLIAFFISGLVFGAGAVALLFTF